ncbi:MAG: hypothetical protein ACQEQ4_08065 [Fibrobacterota bacterium]
MKANFFRIVPSVLGISAVFFLVSCNVAESEEHIGEWIIGTWDIDRYVQENYIDSELTGESESSDQGKIKFKSDSTGYDYGGNFIGSDFTWSHTSETLSLVTEDSETVYDIDEYSHEYFEFSITVTDGDNTDIERWHLSK